LATGRAVLNVIGAAKEEGTTVPKREMKKANVSRFIK
jgi:hypothetical protein